jgi:hypothetical protein
MDLRHGRDSPRYGQVDVGSSSALACRLAVDFSTVYLVGILDGIDPYAICCLPASIEYSFASGFYRDKRWRLQVACSCLITV